MTQECCLDVLCSLRFCEITKFKNNTVSRLVSEALLEARRRKSKKRKKLCSGLEQGLLRNLWGPLQTKKGLNASSLFLRCLSLPVVDFDSLLWMPCMSPQHRNTHGWEIRTLIGAWGPLCNQDPPHGQPRPPLGVEGGYSHWVETAKRQGGPKTRPGVSPYSRLPVHPAFSHQMSMTKYKIKNEIIEDAKTATRKL